MKIEKISAGRGTFLRKNGSQELMISLNEIDFSNIYLINGTSFLTENISLSELIVKPYDFYMVINKKKEEIEINYNRDISPHDVVYNPYKFEYSEKKILSENFFKDNYNIQEGYIDTLPKWYSFKFTYPEYNIIFVKPELGISIQVHEKRTEYWEILEGKPILINGNKVHYYVENNTKFQNSINMYHSVINPNKENFVVIKECWSGSFDENDITRVFNPN